jgi:hypothetical protein
MFIFPATLKNWVAPFKTKGVERISISGNIDLIPLKEDPEDNSLHVMLHKAEEVQPK